MTTYVIIKTEDGSGDIPYLAGNPVDAFSDDALFGRIVPPRYVQIIITDSTDAEFIKATYNQGWDADSEDDGISLKRRYKLTPEVMQAALDSDGSLEMTMTEFEAAMEDQIYG